VNAHTPMAQPSASDGTYKTSGFDYNPRRFVPCPDMAIPSKKAVLQLVREMGLIRPGDLEARGVPRAQLYRLVEEGLVERQARGLYVAARHRYTTEHVLAQVAKRVPAGVFCLLTALRFHELTTQSPAEVWVALDQKARKPRLDYPRLRVARFSGAALTEGIEAHRIEGVEVRVYSAAKTVADCFKYRNKIGIDVAVEALQDFSRQHRGGANELARFARICRVTRVMQPYLDAIA
jgi:predicted transcriptional regulator of viral defense system